MWEDNRYAWVVICKNRWFNAHQIWWVGHKIPIAETDAITPLRIKGPITVRCDECGKENSYQPREVVRAEHEIPESFSAHPVFRAEEFRAGLPELPPSTPIHDGLGSCVAWLDNRTVITPSGRPAALVLAEAVFTYDGVRLGTFHDGFFRDRNGYAVGFVDGATGEPLRPLRQLPPIPPIPMLAPDPPIPPAAPPPPQPKSSWSSLTWDEWVRGGD